MPLQHDPDFDLADPLGVDLYWPDDLDAGHRLESGIALFVHDIFGRITCPKGRNVDDPLYGIDVVEELLHKPLTPAQLNTLPRRIENEIRQDPRTETVVCTLTQTDTNSFTLDISGTTTEDDQPFALVVGVSQALGVILEDVG